MGDINIIKKTKWHKIPIHKKQNNKKRVTLSFNKIEFINSLMNFMNDSDKIRLIDILVFDNKNDKYRIEYVWIVRISENVDIGISWFYNARYPFRSKIFTRTT